MTIHDSPFVKAVQEDERESAARNAAAERYLAKHPPCDVCGKPLDESHDEATCDDLGEGCAVIEPTRKVHVYVPVCVELTLDAADNVVSAGSMHIDLDGHPTDFNTQWECERGEHWTNADPDVLMFADDAVADKLHAQPYLVESWSPDFGNIDWAEVSPSLAHALGRIKGNWQHGMRIDPEDGVTFDEHGAVTHLVVTTDEDHETTRMALIRVDYCDQGDGDAVKPDDLGRAICAGAAGVIKLITE